MKYVLGTAQFGLNYGISNNTGKVSSTNIEKIFRTAIDQGVNYLDTANVYGDAEDKIGTFFELTKQFKLMINPGLGSQMVPPPSLGAEWLLLARALFTNAGAHSGVQSENCVFLCFRACCFSGTGAQPLG